MNRLGKTILAIALTAAFTADAPAQGQYGVQAPPVPKADDMPDKFEGVGIVQNLDAQLPLDAPFVDSEGRAVTLGDYFNANKPVILVVVYYRCPSLCGVVLNSTLNTLKEIPATAGEEFEVVVVSFESTEGPHLAKAKRIGYVSEYGRDAGAKSWHFLTGPAESIERLCKTIGFSYRWNEATKEYIHDAATYVITPTGRISRYLFPNGFSDPRTTRLALTEASSGKVGSLADVLVWRCSHYDPAEGTYGFVAMKIVKTATPLLALTVLAPLLIGVIRARRRNQRNHARAATA